MTKKKKIEPEVELVFSGAELFRLTVQNKKDLKEGATIPLQWICCDCGLEHYIPVDDDNGDTVGRVFRNDVATAKNRKDSPPECA